MRVLLIEDDKPTAKSIAITLAKEGYTTDTAEIGKEDSNGVRLAQLHNYDLIILDLMLPKVDGYQILLRLRSSKIKTPVLILSGLSSVDEKTKGLGFGADDYMTKPYSNKELVARINAIIRRSKGHSESVVRFDKVAINLDTRTVEVDNKQVHLTNKEYAILELLAMRKGTVLTKEMFLSHLYTSMDEPEMKIIDVFVCKLRKKLSDASGGTNYIETVWGRGYMLKDYDSNETSMLSPQAMSEAIEREAESSQEEKQA